MIINKFDTYSLLKESSSSYWSWLWISICDKTKYFILSKSSGISYKDGSSKLISFCWISFCNWRTVFINSWSSWIFGLLKVRFLVALLRLLIFVCCFGIKSFKFWFSVINCSFSWRTCSWFVCLFDSFSSYVWRVWISFW
jgi:hypothetical protein